MQDLIVFCSRPEAANDVISGRFLGPLVPDDFRPEGVGDVISDVDVERVGRGDIVKFGDSSDSRSNGSRDI